MSGPLHRRAWAILLAVAWRVVAQVPVGAPIIQPVPLDSDPLRISAPRVETKKPLFSELDLMRRSDFARACAAMVSVRVQDGQGRAVAGLSTDDFLVEVNGTRRVVRLRARGTGTLAAHQPVVLLVFPPNQPTVHTIAVKDALRFFGAQAEPMPWRVGIFDANATFVPFTPERAELLKNLQAVAVAKEPTQFTGYRFLPRGESTWQQKVEAAISSMARNDGPRMIIAMNPLSEAMYGLNETSPVATLARVSPVDLEQVASLVGAHIYVDNAGGPEVLVPGGEASEAFGSDRAPLTAWQQARVLNYFAFTSSLTMQTARATMGGYANSFKDLGAQMERDLREAYVLEFDLTPEDRDKGVPAVEVRSPIKQLRLAMVDVAPLRVEVLAETRAAERATAAAVLKVMRKEAKPVESGDFRIRQRVDYFPVRGGATPVLPMSGMVEWTGSGARPDELAIAESVMDLDMGDATLEREVETGWTARSVRWERDGELRPGRYLWLVAVHDSGGKILASARERFTVPYQGGGGVGVSSLVIGASCQSAPEPSGLQRRVARTDTRSPVVLVVDPLRLADCRVVPDVADRFGAGETLRALVRLYPSGKLAKLAPEAWKASYALKSKGGATEVSREGTFVLDSSGLVFSAFMPLDTAGVLPGEHVLEVAVRGPGIKGVLTETRGVWVAAQPAAKGSVAVR